MQNKHEYEQKPKGDPRDTAWLSPSDYRFPEAEYRAVSFRDGKKAIHSPAQVLQHVQGIPREPHVSISHHPWWHRCQD